ncbi:MAG: hypothetical protein JKY52_11775 [Flavobacteriales bacterium]|nr:hypothetical protein [Flavobacteriales bacterium]
MKTLNIKLRLPFLVAFFIVVGNVLSAKTVDEFSKTWNKTFTVNPDAILDLDNKYGNVHITTWKQHEISIKVIISVDVSNQEKADKALNRIRIVDEASMEKVIIATRFDSNNSGKLNKKLQVDYVVQMPVSNNLTLVNKFGDVYINQLNGRADLKVAYGNLKCEILNNADNRVRLSFSSGKCTIGDFGSGSIEMKYSKLSIDQADKLDIDSKFSGLSIGSATTIHCKSQYDKLEIERVGDLDLDGKFSGYIIGTVIRNLKLDLEYSGCEVNQISTNAGEISIENSFGGVELGFEEGTSYKLKAKGEFGDIDYPVNNAILTTNERKSNSFFIIGVVGDKTSPEASVDISSKFGKVKLSYK